MEEKQEILLGSTIHLSDGHRGELCRIVLNPTGRIVRHLVVKIKYASGPSRLVPFGLVTVDCQGLRLRCSLDEFCRFDRAEETELVYGNGDPLPLDGEEPSSWTLAVVGSLGLGWASLYEPLFVTHDRVPLGEVAVRRGQCVHASDGDIGRVQGFSVDGRDHQVAAILLQVGHAWNHKQVAIPRAALVRAHDGLEVNLARRDVEALSPAGLPDLETRLAATAGAAEGG